MRLEIILLNVDKVTTYQIQPVRTTGDLEATVQLFRSYAAGIGIDLSFQNFEAELTGMPGKYAPPAGELILARDPSGQPIGCVALRPIKPKESCEMKRLYVLPHGRGLGVGKALVEMAVAVASRIGYREMKMDTIPSMKSAIALYRKVGFVPIAPYYETPLTGTIFLSLSLVA